MPQEEKAKAKTISIKEFKMWLEGVEEMQEENWTPDARQWKRIREKIEQIEEVTASAPMWAPPGHRPRGTADESSLPPGMELVFPPMNGAPPSTTGGTTQPVPSALNVGPAQPTGQPVRRASTASGMPVTLSTGDSKTPVKTPDVDTSKGNYDSQFV